MNNKYEIWFSTLKTLGRSKKLELLKKYKNEEKLFNLKRSQLNKNKVLKEKQIEEILDKEKKEKVLGDMEYLEKNKIQVISIFNNMYPKKLLDIFDPPIYIYVKGDISILNKKTIGIIGCREATEYGKSASKYFGYNLAKQNINIVSGLAKGIDSYAHIGNLMCIKEAENIKKVGKPIGVIGTGLDIIYPKENELLVNEILKQNGVIVSEYSLGTQPNKMNFPARNRIISGLSDEILVVEAKEKSGTSITVDFALEQGKNIYAVPGNINEINATGTNKLIKEGAKLVTRYEDIY